MIIPAYPRLMKEDVTDLSTSESAGAVGMLLNGVAVFRYWMYRVCWYCTVKNDFFAMMAAIFSTTKACSARDPLRFPRGH